MNMIHHCLKKKFYFHFRKELLTVKFYGHKVLWYLRMIRLEAQWKEFHCKLPENQSLLEQALLISQWARVDCEKMPSLSQIEGLIQGIVDRVMKQLADGNRPQKSTRRKILSVINQVLFEEMGFQDSDDWEPSNYLIEKVVALKNKKNHK